MTAPLEATSPTAGGCCTTCPIATTCPSAAPGASTCSVTGSAPPPAPPAYLPTPAGDTADLISRGVEGVASAAFGLGWTDILAAIITGSARYDRDGEPVDWGRLQVGRNLLCIGVVTTVPIGGAPAAWWAAEALRIGAIADPFGSLGVVLGLSGAVFLGRYMPGPVGLLCSLAWAAASGSGRLIMRLLRSRLGWIITRPAIWAGICGVLITGWRGIVYILTGVV